MIIQPINPQFILFDLSKSISGLIFLADFNHFYRIQSFGVEPLGYPWPWPIIAFIFIYLCVNFVKIKIINKLAGLSIISFTITFYYVYMYRRKNGGHVMMMDRVEKSDMDLIRGKL